MPRAQTAETRERIAARLRGRSASPQTRVRMSAAHTGAQHTDETRARIAESMRGNRNRRSLPKRTEPLALSELRERFQGDDEASRWIAANAHLLADLPPEEPLF